MRIWVIIPAYNEAARLEFILQELKKRHLSVLVVDDGSTDQTYTAAKKWADVVIQSPRNFGKGASLRKAISYLLEDEAFDYIITMDADGQHSAGDLENFLKEADFGACFVLGNRMASPKGMPRLRIITNVFMSWIISRIVHQKIPDSQCGFRMIKRDVLQKIVIKTKKFEIESEILIKAARLGFAIKSIPIQSIYFPNPQSKIRPFADTWRFIKFIFRLDNERR